jgi:cell division protease FtsH
MGRDMGHGREYSEAVAAVIDGEVRRLIEAAHDEAWSVLVEYRDVLDHLVLELLEHETLNQAELAAIFTPITKRPPRDVWLSSEERAVSQRPAVLTPGEKALLNGSSLVATMDVPPTPDAAPQD